MSTKPLTDEEKAEIKERAGRVAGIKKLANELNAFAAGKHVMDMAAATSFYLCQQVRMHESASMARAMARLFKRLSRDLYDMGEAFDDKDDSGGLPDELRDVLLQVLGKLGEAAHDATEQSEGAADEAPEGLPEFIQAIMGGKLGKRKADHVLQGTVGKDGELTLETLDGKPLSEDQLKELKGLGEALRKVTEVSGEEGRSGGDAPDPKNPLH